MASIFAIDYSKEIYGSQVFSRVILCVEADAKKFHLGIYTQILSSIGNGPGATHLALSNRRKEEMELIGETSCEG